MRGLARADLTTYRSARGAPSLQSRTPLNLRPIRLAAGAALLIGYLLGDTLDGPVARMTKTSNQFGSELDTATDHFVQGIAPGVIVFRCGQTSSMPRSDRSRSRSPSLS